MDEKRSYSIHSSPNTLIIDCQKFQAECKSLINFLSSTIRDHMSSDDYDIDDGDEDIDDYFDKVFLPLDDGTDGNDNDGTDGNDNDGTVGNDDGNDENDNDDKEDDPADTSLLVERFFSDPILYKILEEMVPNMFETLYRKRPRNEKQQHEDTSDERFGKSNLTSIYNDVEYGGYDDHNIDDQITDQIADSTDNIFQSPLSPQPQASMYKKFKSGASSRDAIFANISSGILTAGDHGNDLKAYLSAHKQIMEPLSKTKFASFNPLNRTILNEGMVRQENILSKSVCDVVSGFGKQVGMVRSVNEGDSKKPEKAIGEDELVFTVSVSMAGRPHRQMQEFLMLGSQSLSVLRERIYCISDRIQEYVQNPNDYNSAPCLADVLNRKVRGSGLFFIEGAFYNDMHEGCIDYSGDIIEWFGKIPAHKVPYCGVFNSHDMDSVCMKDLNLRTMHPYLFLHQGNCEHIIIVKEIRRFHPYIDSDNANAYPICTFLSRWKRKVCKVCDLSAASILCYDDPLCPESPMPFCEPCFDLLHKDAEGNLLYTDFRKCKFIQV